MPAIAGAQASAEVDQVTGHEAVPVEAVVCALPQGRRGIEVGLALEGVGDVEGVGEEQRGRLDERLEQAEVVVLVGVVQRLLAQGQELGGHYLVDHVALYPAHGLGLGNDDDVLVFTCISIRVPWCCAGEAYLVAA